MLLLGISGGSFELLVRYSSFSAISKIRCLVSSFTLSVGSSFSTRDTVASETPASVAMSLMLPCISSVGQSSLSEWESKNITIVNSNLIMHKLLVKQCVLWLSSGHIRRCSMDIRFALPNLTKLQSLLSVEWNFVETFTQLEVDHGSGSVLIARLLAS